METTAGLRRQPFTMEPMEDKTVRQQAEPQRAVFGSREWFWKEAAGLSAVVFFAVLAGAGIAWTYLAGDGDWVAANLRRRERAKADEQAKPPEETAAPAAVVRRAIDGLPMPEGAAEPSYYAVTIDNHSDARPQAGVTAASLVYEAPVEGGITRLLAVFAADAEAKSIGPVRSARPYFLDWAAELDSVYVHVGGSPEALDRIKATPAFKDLNEYFAGKYFWRDKVRRAPHSTLTSIEFLRQAEEARFADRDRKTVLPWRFKDDAAEADRPEAAELTVGYGEPYRVTWKYDRATNSFARLRGGREEKDSAGVPVRAKNVVVQFVMTKVLDEVGRRSIDTKGGGEALVAVDGAIIGGRWKFADGRTRFVDAAGNEISFVAGQTWIEVVPNDTPVSH
jgi:hypothetical protein